MPFRSSRAPPSGFFVQLDQWKTAARKAGRDIIDLSVGASDLPCPQEALETLREATYDPSTYSYCLKNDTIPFLQAACDWYERRYGVRYSPQSEALCLIGSQEGLAHLLLGVTEHGDSVMLCDVAYPSYWGALTIAGLKPTYLPIDTHTGLPDLARVDTSKLDRVKCLLLNYPNNPTAVTATNEFFQTAIDFCKQHGLLLIHDNPYVDLVYEGQTPSPLALPGGKDCCIELFSFAKSHHIAGFRLGFALGNAEAIGALESVKAPIDFNVYLGVQRMGITCLGLSEDRVKRDAQRWRRRAQCMVDALDRHAGWSVRMPTSGMYLWAPLPTHTASNPPTQPSTNGHATTDGTHQPTATQGTSTQGQQINSRTGSDVAVNDSQAERGDDLNFCRELLAATGVALSPGSGFGPGGRGYVRIVLVQDEERLEEAAKRIGVWLKERASVSV